MERTERIRGWFNSRAGQFLLTQLFHTVITVLVVTAIFLGAARAGALNGVLALAAQVPQSNFTTVNYQGRLADPAGNPIDNPNPGLGMTFALYDVQTGGSPLWNETHANVPVSNGLFSVRLGSINALDTGLLSGDRWLGIQVGTDPEMTPRENLAAVPYAMMAATVPDGAIGSRQFAPSWYEAYNSETDITTSDTFVPTGVSVVFTCDVDCTALILHRSLVSHSLADARVDVQVQVDGVGVLNELGVINVVDNTPPAWNKFHAVEGWTFTNLPAGTHTVEVLFRCTTAGTCTYYGGADGNGWERLSVLLFAQP